MKKIKLTTTQLFTAAFLMCGLMTIHIQSAPTLRANGKIAFTSDRDGNSEIYLMNADGSGQTRLTDGADGMDNYPTWSPDGRKIAFVRFGGSGRGWQINVMNADGTNMRQIIALNPTGNFGTYGLSWSPDGAKLAFDYSRDTYTINVDGSNRVNLTNGIFAAYAPSWSPDGTRIAFQGLSPGGASNIYTMNVNGGDVRQITNNGDYFSGIFSPDYSPSGAQIAFSLSLDDGNGSPGFQGIGLINFEGADQQLIPTHGPMGSAKWSPDGKKLIFDNADTSNPNASQIWVTNIDGSGLMQLTNGSGSNFNPDWQPLTPELGFTVTRSDDRFNTCLPGDCSLREAVNAANASATDDTINFATSLTRITLTNEIVINKAGTLTINGLGANNLTIDGGAGTNRIFYINEATVTISGVTLTGGNGTGASFSGYGGAIFAFGGYSPSYYGGAFGDGSLTLDGVHVTGNRLANSIYSGGGYSGGGVNFFGGKHRIINSTISGNTAGSGGGFAKSFSSLTVVNSTISGNTATVSGGGFLTSGYTALFNVTITNNTAQRGGGFLQFSAHEGGEDGEHSGVDFGNTIVAGNNATTGPEILFSVSDITYIRSAGGNLVGDSPGDSTNTGSPIAYQPTDLRDTNPMLGALQNNGGTTPTHALLAKSPAIDKGINAYVRPLTPSFDQRGTGFARIRDGNGDGIPTVDIGAFEVQSSATASRPTPFDFDGDGKADISVFRPSNGAWYLNQSTNGLTGIQFGFGTDKIVPADYDGDGKTDVAVYRSGTWYLQRSQLGFIGIAFGATSDIPMPADFDGDGKAEIAVFRPSDGGWYIYNLANNQFTSTQFGQAGDIPVAVDYDGDGKADVAVFRNGIWYLQRSQLGFTAVTFGQSGDKPVPADYDGDGKADVAVFRPSNGTWYLLQSRDGFTGAAFGYGTDLPVPADYDGDGKADIAVFRPSNGAWYLQTSQSGFTGVAFGYPTDKPVPNAFVP